MRSANVSSLQKHCLSLPLHNDAALTQSSYDRAVLSVLYMGHIRICWCMVLWTYCTTSCTLHVSVNTADTFNSVNCYFNVSRTANEFFPLCLNYFYGSRTVQSVILMFTVCLFMDVFSAANCKSTLGTDTAVGVGLKWITLKLVAKLAFLNRLLLKHPLSNAGFSCFIMQTNLSCHFNDILGQMSLMCQDVTAPSPGWTNTLSGDWYLH